MLRGRSPLAFVVAGSMLAGACGLQAEGAPRAVSVEVRDGGLAVGAGGADTSAPAVEIPASVYVVTEAGRLRATTRDVPTSRDPSVHLAAVVEVLVAGPTAGEATTGLRSAVPSTTEVLAVEVDDGTATVDLSPGFASIGGRRELLAVGQLVLTVTTAPGVRRMRVRLDGRPTDLPLPDGSLTERPVGLPDYVSLLEPGAGSPTAESGS